VADGFVSIAHMSGRPARPAIVRPWSRLIALVAAVGVLLPVSAGAIEGDTVVLQGLDKVTARVVTFEVRIGEVVRFGTLEIQPRFCDRAPPEEPPESKAFLDILEARAGESKAEFFHGWMFASSPALNALEHPVYDVWVLDCKRSQDPAPPPAAEPGDKR
jgi:hypothetical protein